nr:polysaccharide deacetylase family protein [Bacillus cereus]
MYKIIFTTFFSAPYSQDIQLISTQPTTHMQKTIPEQYNGKVRKVVYLTFDDGPGEYTNKLLDILKENKIKATFFLIGSHAQQYPNLVRREYNEGNYVGLHSMTHEYKPLYTQKKYVEEMKATQQIVHSIIGINPTLTRPPYGSKPGLTEDIQTQVLQNNLHVWDWTIDSNDWKLNALPLDKSVPQIVENVISHATENIEVILMHDIHPQSVAAIPEIIRRLKNKGYEFETYCENQHFPLNFWHNKQL